MLSRTTWSNWLGWAELGIALDGRAVGVLDGAETGGYPGFAGGDGLAVAAAVGAFGQGLAESFYFADVGFAFVGVGGDGEDGDARGGGVEDEGDRLAVGVAAGQGDRPAVSGLIVESCEHGVGAVDLVAGRAEVLADGAEVGAAGGAVLHEPGGFRLVCVGAGAGVDAQLGLERRADRSGFDEADQALSEDRGLRPGGQPDGQPPGGDMVDGAPPAVRGGDAVADEPLVQRQVRERPVLGQPVAASWPGCYAVICLPHGSGWSVGGLRVWLSGWFVLACDVAGWLGCGGYCLGSGEAEFGGPALHVRPEPVALVDMLFGGGVGQDHRGDRGVAVQDLAGEPGHFPSVPTGCVPGGVGGLVAGHGGVVDGQGHGSASRSGSGSRVRAGPASRSSAREGGWPGRQPRSWSTTITCSGRPGGHPSGNGRS